MSKEQQLGSVDPQVTATALYSCVDRLQHYPIPSQVIAAVGLALSYSEHYGIRLPELIQYTQNVIFSKDGKRQPAYRALDAYVRNAIKKPSENVING